MHDCSITQLVEKARSLKEENKKWHFHYMTPDCHFSTSSRHIIIPEHEHGPSLVAGSLHKPVRTLQELEDLARGGE